MSPESEYVLGTHDEEIARLELQHRVWRPHATAAWGRAGFSAGHHIADVGCGPGFASIDLARLVGPSGRVTAIDQSRRFLSHLQQAATKQDMANITTVERDLDRLHFIDDAVDGAWARWVFAFVRDPRALLARIAARVAAGGAIAIHEYFDYASWRTAPPSEELDEFVRTVIESWRKTGGEPDIALSLPRWLEELGFEVIHTRPIVDMVHASDPQWDWLVAFIESGRKRLMDLGELSPQRANAIGAAARSWAIQRPPVRMVTPAVLELIAIRP